MQNHRRKICETVLRTGKLAALIIVGGVVIHTAMMVFDYLLVPEPLYLNLRQNFMDNIFAAPMRPMMTAYGALFLLIYSLQVRGKKVLQTLQQKEIQREKVELVFKAMQQITGIVAELIAANNAEILSWVEHRKVQGHKISNKIERPARNIANALQSLSELSFLVPYTDNIPTDAAGIEILLKSKLDIKYD